MNTVTANGWNVSALTCSYEKGAQLSVFKLRGAKFQYGEGNGRRFETSEAAFAWALEHGYLEIFRTAWCRHCRTAHTFLGRRSGFCQDLGIFTSNYGLYDPKTGQVDTSIRTYMRACVERVS